MKNATSTKSLPATLMAISLVFGLGFFFGGCGTSPVSCNPKPPELSGGGTIDETAALAKAASATQKYTVTITTDGHGTTKPSGSVTVTAGQALAIGATVAKGYTFNGWSVVSGSVTFASANASSLAASVKPAAGNATLKANFIKASSNWVCRGTTRVGKSPVGIIFDGTSIWVADENGEDIYKIQASTGAVLKVYRGGHGAQYLAYDNVNKNVWVTNPGSNNVTVINASTGKLVTYASGNNPDGIAFDGANMWVANFSSATVTKMRASDGAVLATISVGTAGVSNPRLLAYDKTARCMWVTVCGDNTVKKIDVSSNKIVGDYAVPGYPYAIVFDGTYMWVTEGLLNRVAKLRTSDGAILGTYYAGVAPNGIAFDGTYIWITNQVGGGVPFYMGTVCTVTQIQAANGAAMGTNQVGERPQWVACGAGYVWVTNGSDNTVTRYTFK